MNESTLLRAIMKEASRAGARVFRVNTGAGWIGSVKRVSPTRIIVDNPRLIRCGLCTGGSDLIGWSREGHFLGIEIKAGRTATTDAQEKFIAAVLKAGGRAGIARSVADAMKIIEGT